LLKNRDNNYKSKDKNKTKRSRDKDKLKNKEKSNNNSSKNKQNKLIRCNKKLLLKRKDRWMKKQQKE
jgi:hypothetical protein